MGGKKPSLNSHGFTITEVMVGAALLIIALLATSSVVQQSLKTIKGTSSKLALENMKTLVINSLSDSNTCAARMKSVTAGAPPSRIQINPASDGDWITATISDPQIYVETQAGGQKLVAHGDQANFMQYRMNLLKNQSVQTEVYAPDPSDPLRINGTRQFLTILRIEGNRDAANTPQTDRATGARFIHADIPMIVEFDRTTGDLVSCTLNPEDNDNDLLYAPAGQPRRTVKQCRDINGRPFPTELGLVCWVPNLNPDSTQKDFSCTMYGWQDLNWVSVEPGTSLQTQNNCGPNDSRAAYSQNFGPSGIPYPPTYTAQICRRSCSGFNFGGTAIAGAAGGVITGGDIFSASGLGFILNLFCLRRRCNCATYEHRYLYTVIGRGCY